MNVPFIKGSFLLLILSLLSGCVRDRSLLSKLTVGMSKQQVKSKIGAPDVTHSPGINKKGELIDLWEYNLATHDKVKDSKLTAATIVAQAVFPPLAAIPSLVMDSPYSYHDYLLKFVNDALACWGKKNEMNFREQIAGTPNERPNAQQA